MVAAPESPGEVGGPALHLGSPRPALACQRNGTGVLDATLPKTSFAAVVGTAAVVSHGIGAARTAGRIVATAEKTAAIAATGTRALWPRHPPDLELVVRQPDTELPVLSCCESQDLSELCFKLASAITKEVGSRRRHGEDLCHDVIDGSGQVSSVWYHDNLGTVKARFSEHGRFVVWRCVTDRGTGAAMGTEVVAPQPVDSWSRYGRQRRGCKGVLVPVVDVDDHTFGVQHFPYGMGHELSVHPVERGCEGNDPEQSELCWQVLGSHVHPAGVGHLALHREPSSLLDHLRISVYSDDLAEEVADSQPDSAWAAADIKEAPRSIQTKSRFESAGQGRGVR